MSAQRARLRVLIADDHNVLREGLRMLIDAQADMTVVAEATSGDDVVPEALAAQPDVILLDITMPGASGLEVIPWLREAIPDARVLVLTMHDDPAYYHQALRAGANGYVLKRATSAELLAAVRAVGAGERFVDLATARSIVENSLGDATRTPRPAAPPAPPTFLDGRSAEVLRLLASGSTPAETARRLRLSVRTVERYRARLFRRLGVRSRADLIRYAKETGLLAEPPAQGEDDPGEKHDGASDAEAPRT